jgi:hypothetical protein
MGIIKHYLKIVAQHAANIDQKTEGWMPTQYKDVAVTSAELLALYTTAKTLVAAETGKVHIFKGIKLFLDFNSAAYAGIAAGENLSVKYTSSTAVAKLAEIETVGFLDSTGSDMWRYAEPAHVSSSGGPAESTPVVSAPLVLALEAGNIITGDSPLYVRVFYQTMQAGYAYWTT